MLINEQPKKIARKKAIKRRLFKEITLLYSRNNGNSTNDKKRRSNAFIVRNTGRLIENYFWLQKLSTERECVNAVADRQSIGATYLTI